jgi:hypothetical protein
LSPVVKYRIGVTAIAAVPESEGPQALPGGIAVERFEEGSGARVKGVDLAADRVDDAVDVAIGKVADQQVVAERTEIARGQGDAPW